jgi:hypothetical protein
VWTNTHLLGEFNHIALLNSECTKSCKTRENIIKIYLVETVTKATCEIRHFFQNVLRKGATSEMRENIVNQVIWDIKASPDFGKKYSYEACIKSI